MFHLSLDDLIAILFIRRGGAADVTRRAGKKRCAKVARQQGTFQLAAGAVNYLGENFERIFGGALTHARANDGGLGAGFQLAANSRSQPRGGSQGRAANELALHGAANSSLSGDNYLKTLHRYITGQVLAALVLTVAVFAFVVLLVNVLHDVLPLLLGGHVPLRLVAKAIALLLPFACVYALPMGLITATLLVFGRFSVDQELTAMRASGVSLLCLITPVLMLSLLCCVLSAWFNLEIGPRSRVEFLTLKYDLMHNAVEAVANAEIPAGQLVSFPPYQLYVGKNQEGNLEDVYAYRMENETNWDALIHAAHGQFLTNRTPTQLTVALDGVQIIHSHATGMASFDRFPLILDLSATTNKTIKPKISDMTFGQLLEEMGALRRGQLTPANLSSPAALADLAHLNLTVKTNASEEETSALLREAGKIRGQQIGEVRVAMHREIAFSFACFGFTLVGIPLGIRVQRRETNIGIALALILVIVYYGFTMLGDSLAGRPELYPYLILWLPNFIFQAIGAALLWRANRGL
jgi:lipopolysaccharide export system permease protein